MKTETKLLPPRGRGHSRGLDREKIITAAVALARNGSRGEPTLRQVADRFSVDVAALYWHFPNKAALLEAVAEAAASALDLSSASVGSWQESVLRLCVQIRSHLSNHPELRLSDGASTWTTPFNAHATAQLAIQLEPAGLSERKTLFAASSLLQLITVLTQSQLTSQQSSFESNQRFTESVLTELPPQLREAWSEIAHTEIDWVYDDLFTFSVGVFIDGIGAQIERSGPTRAPNARTES